MTETSDPLHPFTPAHTLSYTDHHKSLDRDPFVPCHKVDGDIGMSVVLPRVYLSIRLSFTFLFRARTSKPFNISRQNLINGYILWCRCACSYFRLSYYLLPCPSTAFCFLARCQPDVSHPVLEDLSISRWFILVLYSGTLSLKC
ncbi:hypothetical protein GJAV_G00184030 [Gymnothorax javanicus]|nr:hypothetical protein GJAV_G00184030 [Gymnothorax javanicus]